MLESYNRTEYDIIERTNELKRDLNFIEFNNKLLNKKVATFEMMKKEIGKNDKTNIGFFKFKIGRLQKMDKKHKKHRSISLKKRILS